jgi:hypothetical protein
VQGRLVDFVDNNNWLEAELERFLKHKAGLWHRALLGIDNQQHRVDRAQHALYFGTEVGVAWSVHNVDLGAFVLDSGVFGINGDAALFFDVVAVHRDTFGSDAGLAHQSVGQGSLAVVHVSDNCDVTYIHIIKRSDYNFCEAESPAAP